jgi:hypothetical protein
MPLDRLLTGHGPPVTDHRRLIAARIAEHKDRCTRIAEILRAGPQSAYDIAGRLWSAGTVAEQPLLVIFEVVGHLELLLAAGHVTEDAARGRSTFALTPAGRAARRGPSLPLDREQANRPPCIPTR